MKVLEMFDNTNFIIKNKLPKALIHKAEVFVAAHKPKNPALKDFELLAMAGLDIEEHSDLNRSIHVFPKGAKGRDRRLNELRDKYRDDLLALEQIDQYDSNSPYGIKHTEIIE